MLNRKIRFFISVVENGSFSKAAKELYLSQSAISQQIVQLEDELGAVLFDRAGYRPTLTESGKYFYNECKRISSEYENIIENTRKIHTAKKSKLRIGITGPLEKKHIPVIINEYKKLNKDIYIELKKIKFKSGVDKLNEEKLDVCFGIQNEFRKSEDIKTINLLKHKVCAICSKEHHWAGRQNIEPYEITDEPIISLSRQFGELFYLDFIRSFKEDGVIPNIVQEADDLEELLLAVKINQGIALVSKEVVDENDEICILDISNTHHHADFCIGYIENEEKPFIKEFVSITESYFKKIL